MPISLQLNDYRNGSQTVFCGILGFHEEFQTPEKHLFYLTNSTINLILKTFHNR